MVLRGSFISITGTFRNKILAQQLAGQPGREGSTDSGTGEQQISRTSTSLALAKLQSKSTKREDDSPPKPNGRKRDDPEDGPPKKKRALRPRSNRRIACPCFKHDPFGNHDCGSWSAELLNISKLYSVRLLDTFSPSHNIKYRQDHFRTAHPEIPPDLLVRLKDYSPETNLIGDVRAEARWSNTYHVLYPGKTIPSCCESTSRKWLRTCFRAKACCTVHEDRTGARSLASRDSGSPFAAARPTSDQLLPELPGKLALVCACLDFSMTWVVEEPF